MIHKIKIIFFCAIVLSSSFVKAFDSSHTLTIQTSSAKIPVRVALAKTYYERANGLMFVKDLENDQGMLFIYPKLVKDKFWMKNTPTPLDILFVSQDKEILYIEKSTIPYSETPIDSGHSFLYVLEVKAGFTNQHHISIGDKLIFNF